MKLKRRDFVKSFGLASSAILLNPTPMFLNTLLSKESDNEIISLYEELISIWSNGMIRNQVSLEHKGLHGGLLCPSCGIIHGRCLDAVYPFMYMAEKTGVERYLQGAIDVMKWSDNVFLPNKGAYVNDIKSSWKGISAFGAISLGEAYRYHNELLPQKVKSAWIKRLEDLGNFLHGFMVKEVSNINYPVTASYSLALIGELTGNDKLLVKANNLIQIFMEHITENNLLYGEGKPYAKKSGKGLPPVDLGYNVEETLSGVAMYADLVNNEEVKQKAAEVMKAHVEFMLPDGAWDNSWGTRSYKWTYWGSRTTVGAHAALHLLADNNPSFARAAYLNTKLMKRSTGKEGLLYGGPHYGEHGIPPCIHHTFCHAKSLAHVLNRKEVLEKQSPNTLIPREKSYGVKTFSELDTHLIANKNWKGTVTAYDWMFYGNGTHVRGGALSMLWHQKIGAVFASGIIDYTHKLETPNMQWLNDPNAIEITPRLELIDDGKVYLSITDFNAKISIEQGKQKVVITAQTSMVDKDQNAPQSGSLPLYITYIFDNDEVTIILKATDKRLCEADFYLPLISTNNEVYIKEKQKITLQKLGGNLILHTNQEIVVGSTNETNRVFSHVPGMEAIPLKIKWKNPNEDVKVILKVI